MAAQDTPWRTLYHVVCAYDKLDAKVLLAVDPVDGAMKLVNLPEITGAGVTMCGYLRFGIDGYEGSNEERA